MKPRLWLATVFAALLGATVWGQNAPAGNPEAKTYFAEAQKLTRDGKFDEALAAFAKGIALDPGNQQAVVMQAGLFMSLNQSGDALKVWDQWIELKPDDPQRWLYKSVAAGESGHPDEALQAEEKLTQLQPNNPDGWRGKAQSLAALNRNAEALQAIDRSLELDPMADDSWVIRLALESSLKEYDSSIKFCSQIFAQKPQCIGAVYDRAGLYALKGDKARALADLKRALAIRSDEATKAFARQDERFKNLRNDPQFQKLTGNAGVASPVSLLPTAPVTGKKVTIQYAAAGRNLASAAQIYLHLGWNHWNPVVSPDATMTLNPASSRWEYTTTVPDNATELNCVFNNGAGAWDNNGGADWLFPVAASPSP